MKTYFLHTQTLLIGAFLLLVTSCNGQTHTRSPENSSIEQKTSAKGQARLVKTQGSTPSDNVRAGLQDKAGNLWFITTGEGVYRYDGQWFTQFTVKDGLPTNTVWSILEDQAGKIWFGTSDGLCRYDGERITPVPFSVSNGAGFYTDHPAGDPARKNEIFSMIQDRSGLIWFGTSTGMYCYNGRLFSLFTDRKGLVNKDTLSLQSVQCMMQDRQGNIWFGSGPMVFEGICLYDGKTLSHFKPKDEGWIRNMLEDSKGVIWFGTRHYGACRYDGTGFVYYTGKVGIGNPMLEDKAGNLWFAGEEKLNTVESEAGIWRYDGKSYTNFSTRDGMGPYSVWSMLEDRAGNIWFGTRNMGLYSYDGKTFSRFSE